MYEQASIMDSTRLLCQLFVNYSRHIKSTWEHILNGDLAMMSRMDYSSVQIKKGSGCSRRQVPFLFEPLAQFEEGGESPAAGDSSSVSHASMRSNSVEGETDPSPLRSITFTGEAWAGLIVVCGGG
jgi:hypothetical protein